MAFDDFAEDAAELFGLNENEAADLADMMEEVGFDPDTESLDDDVWADMASEFLSDVSSEWDLRDDWPDDDWAYADAEYEVTVTYEEGK